MSDLTYPTAIPSEVPARVAVVHNSVRPAKLQGTRGFRYWLAPLENRLTVCDCGWAPDLRVHYRVTRKAPGEVL